MWESKLYSYIACLFVFALKARPRSSGKKFKNHMGPYNKVHMGTDSKSTWAKITKSADSISVGDGMKVNMRDLD